MEDDKYPTKDGYLFAGWYTTNELPENDEEAVEYAVEDSIPEGTQIVYALFVPDDVLTVQAQASVHLIDDAVTTADENGALRFVTTVDSLLYKKVGFELSYVKDGVEKTATSASNKVYKALYQADSTTSWSVTPAETFCGVSEYFKACTVKSIEADNYGTEFTVKAFWVTMSGDKVYGATAVKVLQDGCVRKTVYVSSTPDISAVFPYYGTEANPYASLNYAIEHVKDGGTVRVKDSLTVASDATWTGHGKTITVTGDGKNDNTDAGKETLDFSTQSAHLNIKDNVTFTALNLTFKPYVFCNGYSVKVTSDVNLLNVANEVIIYGGGNTNVVGNTNLELYAGSYKNIYGGSHNANVTGNTNVVIGPGVNGTADPSSHEKTYLLYGGCRIGNVGGNTNVIVQKAEEGETPAKFNYVYGGGGYAASTSTTATVIGQTNVEFAGQAYSLYGGGRYGTNADTRLVMTGGEVYQIFGGCEYNSMTGNADVQVLGGKVYRRIYGGCYNNYSTDLSNWGWSDTLYQVTGYTSVTIGAAAEASLDTDDDRGLLAVSRYDSTFSNEWGTLIFNDDMYDNTDWNLSSEIGSDFFTGNQAYHYLVTANAGGDVYSAGDFIYIKPDSGNVATVTIDGVVKHYTECNSYYQLPALTSSQEEIVVTFGTTKATDFIANAAAKISTGSETYAYYETLAQAIAAADKSENATITAINATELASISIADSENGTVTSNYKNCVAGTEVTLTVEPKAGYYCSALSVTKDGEADALNEELTIDGTAYTFDTEAGAYTVEATFAKKVFDEPTSSTNTSWDLIKQNESTETLANGGTKITGTVVTTDLQTSDKMDAIAFVDTFTEMDFTFVAKDDPSTTAGNSTPGTQVVMDFGDGCSYQIRVVKNSGNIVLRAVGGLEKSVNRYTFTTEQADKFNSADGVEVRIVRYGTEIMFYVDGAYATTVDLSEFDNSIVTDDTEMTVSIKRFGDTGTAIAIPFTVVNKVSPVAVEVYDDASELVANDTVAADVQNIDLTSNETYSVTLTPQGFDSTAYFKITYVDHLTNETQSVYTPAVAAGESFEFTYQNGVFDSETEAEVATIRWENRIKATKDVLTVEVISGTPEVNTIASGATLGNAPMAKPLATTVETTWTIGTNVGSYNHAVAEGFTPGQHYAHTDVITVAKAGTKLTFTDDVKTNSWASDGCYVVSSWKLDEDGEWVLDKDGTNIPGKYAASKTITCTDGYDTFVERYGTEDDDGSITYTYITSKDNENIMFCYYAGKGTTEFPTITSIYSGETGTAEEIALVADTTEWLESDKTRAYYDIFEGKTISVIGDSYMAGSSIADTSDVWVNMFATKYNMTMNNHGVNGSTISNYAGSTYNPMVDRWEEDFANDTPDIIIVEGGRNDYNYNTPMGVLGNSDKATFKGATTYLISSLREKYPNAIIIGITCWEVGGEKNDAGYYCSDYGRAFIEVCEDLDVSYINAMDSDAMGVYMTSSNYRGRFCIKAGDISHLNEKGMKLVLPVFERKIYEFYNEYLNQ